MTRPSDQLRGAAHVVVARFLGLHVREVEIGMDGDDASGRAGPKQRRCRSGRGQVFHFHSAECWTLKPNKLKRSVCLMLVHREGLSRADGAIRCIA
jgi:hypothetical protein